MHQADDEVFLKGLESNEDNEVTRTLDHYYSGCEVQGCRERIRKIFH